MKIWRPIKTNKHTQGFKQNLPCVIKDERPFRFVPCGSDNSEKLYTDALNMLGHSGWDHASYYKEPIYFPVQIPGIEWEAATHVDGAGAVTVVVRSTTPVPLVSLPEHTPGALSMIKNQYKKQGGKLYLQIWFVHLQGTHINSKVPIKFGDLVGLADSSGASSGNHLHWSMKVSDPGSWFYIDGDNGLQGAIDFSPYFVNTYVLDILKAQSTDIKALQLTVIDLANQVVSLLRQLISLKSK